jgi:F0F1-type ATP synthase assembly protein I
MKLTNVEVIFCIGGTFGLLAALMAFLITFQEYTRHYADKGKVRKMAFKTAAFTLAFFLIAGLLVAILLDLFIWGF